jgi:hypothetical protein
MTLIREVNVLGGAFADAFPPIASRRRAALAKAVGELPLHATGRQPMRAQH